jgi:hypothetical protein
VNEFDMEKEKRKKNNRSLKLFGCDGGGFKSDGRFLGLRF